MAHTDRDDARWFWKDHFAWRKGNTKHCDPCRGEQSCWCEHDGSESFPWRRRYSERWGRASWWNRDCRREERNIARTQLQKARTGKIEWDNLTISYRRPYYW
jgi:hypothetical protein